MDKRDPNQLQSSGKINPANNGDNIHTDPRVQSGQNSQQSSRH